MARLFVENLTVIDCCTLHPQRGLVGESWIVEIELEGDLDEQGMMMDFGEVKRVLKSTIDDAIDHRLVVPRNSPNLTLEAETERQNILLYTYGDGNVIRHSAPAQAVVILDVEEITLSAVQQWVRDLVVELVTPNVMNINVTLREESIEGFHYHYSHGLKKHAGNCQRIAHGHRSRIVIEENNHRSPFWEKYWAECFSDIYIGTMQDVVNRTTEEGRNYIHFAYHSGQGQFSLSLPAAQCYLIPNDSTVENIATHIAEELHKRQPQSHFRVRAYEGVAKGALAQH